MPCTGRQNLRFAAFLSPVMAGVEAVEKVPTALEVALLREI